MRAGNVMKLLTLSNLKDSFSNATCNHSENLEEARFAIGSLSVNLSKLSINEKNSVCENDSINCIDKVSSETVMACIRSLFFNISLHFVQNVAHS